MHFKTFYGPQWRNSLLDCELIACLNLDTSRGLLTMFISCVASSVVTAASKFCLKIGLGRERIVRLGAKTNRKDIPDSWLLVFLSTQNPGLPAHIRRCNWQFFFLLSLTYLMPPTHRQMTGPPHQTSLVTQRPFMWAQVATALPLKLFFNE